MKTQVSQTPAFGLIAWLEQTRIALPLKGVEARFTVRGDLAEVQMDQIYHQNQGTPVDVLYTFPLPDGAAVHRCELHVNDRIIRARVEELEEARRLYREKKSAGHRAALVESVRANLFELALGNLAPGDTVVLRLVWLQSLERLGGEWSLRIPLCPGIRYIPGEPLLRKNSGRGTADDTDQVPDASRLSPPRITDLHPDAAYVSIEGNVETATAAAESMSSPSHTLVLRESNGSAMLRLGDRAAVPDRDFILRGRDASPAGLTSAAWRAENGEDAYALVRLVAPAKAASADEAALDVYFLVDRSGSMGGVKWEATCRAFRSFLTNLAPQDRAWVTFFESTHRDLAEKPLPPAAILAEPIVQGLEKWGVAGGTELLPAVKHVLEQVDRFSRQRRTALVLITDGQAGNEAAIAAVIHAHPELRVFTFGIDTVVNDTFLRQLARRQRGACHLASPHDDLVKPIAALAAKLRRPVLIDLAPSDGWELPGDAPPDLHAGECVSLVLRRTAAGAPLALHARHADDSRESFVLPPAAEPFPAIEKLWQRERITWLLAQHRAPEAIALSCRAGLVCEGTAFIAWDEAERVAIRGETPSIYQPSMAPDEWDYAAAGGSAPHAMDALACAPAPAPAQLQEPSFSLGSSRKSVALELPPPTQYLVSANFVRRELRRRHARSAAETGEDLYARDGAALLSSKSPQHSWRAALEALMPASPDAGSLLDWLEQWAMAEPDQSAARAAMLDDIVRRLSTVAMQGRAAELMAWLENNLKPWPAFLRPCSAAAARLFSIGQTS